MARHRRIVFDEIWVRVSQNRLTLAQMQLVVALHEILNEINKMKRLLFLYSTFRSQNGRRVLGVQLQRDVQHWLSPPDPSTNHDFVWNLHHEGTAAWFLASDVFKKWKTAGSLLWIHGKHMSLQLRTCLLR